MEFDLQDQEVIRFLKKLKDVDAEYPEKMLVARRRSFLKRMIEIELGVPADQGIRYMVSNPKPFNLSPAVSTLLETVLVVAILAEASWMVYFYRERLVDFFQAFTSVARVQDGTPLPVIPISADIQEITPSPSITPSALLATTAETPTGIVVMPTGTSIPNLVEERTITPEMNQLRATPVPNEDQGNNGNHYGQTPKPERTKDNNGKPPKDDKPPKDKGDDKPPKDK
jgi:hypothetical protein